VNTLTIIRPDGSECNFHDIDVDRRIILKGCDIRVGTEP